MSTSDFSSHFRDVSATNFAGRDMHLNVEVHLTGAEAEERLVQLSSLLRRPDVVVGDGAVTAQDQRLAIDTATADALVKYIAARPTEDAQEREEAYLMRLCLDTGLRRIYSRYVPLSGGYRPVRELSPTYSRILVRGDGPQRTIERVRLDDIRQAVTEHPAFILLAQPGAGKTTVLQRLALEMALTRLREGGDALLPIFVRLASQKVDEAPIDFLARMWREEAPGLHTDTTGEIATALRSGRLCLLCDALNEARREKYRERMQEWADFAQRLPVGNRLLFSCRTQDYSGGLAVQQVEVDPLSESQIQDFARLYLGSEKGNALWRELQSAHSDLLDLATIPYYLLLMTEAYEDAGTLPRHRASLFASFVERLLLREMEEKRHAEWIDPAAQNIALGRLAYAMQELGTGTQVDTEWAKAAIPQSVSLEGQTTAMPPETVLRLGTAANLLALPDGDAVRFIHHLLQEYFAAEELLRRQRAGDDLTALWQVPSLAREMPDAVRGEYDPLPEPPTSGWEQTTILASGLYPALIDTVRPVNPALAARCILELGEDGIAAQKERSQTALLERLGNVAIHLRSRMEAGLLLGRLGDPRFAVETVKGVQVILPPMVEIPAATATIGSAWWDIGAFSDEKPRHKVELLAYAIGRYPVTNAEYACFLKAGGYEEERHWSDGGKYWLRGEPVPGEDDPADWYIRTWEEFKADPSKIDQRVQTGVWTARDAQNWRNFITWAEEQWRAAVAQLYPQNIAIREPRYWQDIAYNNPSQPVVGVCWYEAVAYANWLVDVTGTAYRLPGEPEWEWAARRDGRIFPWGRTWDETKLNSLEGRVMRTTPVGAYPHGTTPDGIHDMAGNVWEWTATRHASYPYKSDGDLEDLDATGVRIARGGGWSANRKQVRCAYRCWVNPRGRGSDDGYRLATGLSR
jgi:formylglycine-generating enzyme required for sulfatase activity